MKNLKILKKNLIFTLFGLKYARKNGCKHDLKIAPQKILSDGLLLGGEKPI